MDGAGAANRISAHPGLTPLGAHTPALPHQPVSPRTQEPGAQTPLAQGSLTEQSQDSPLGWSRSCNSWHSPQPLFCSGLGLQDRPSGLESDMRH